MDDVRSNALNVMERVAKAAEAAGRSAGDVTLVAASKMNDAQRVREAYAAGIRAFGENRVQEMEEKLVLDAYAGAELHFIGHLQRNKVKNVVGKAQLIHSVDSPELIKLISERAEKLGIVQDVLIEVNIGGEESKSGIRPEQTDELLALASGFKGIFVKGLMTIPPVSDDASKTIRYFDAMTKLFIDMSAKKYDNVIMKILSMGMSADFEEAIRAGSNLVRVGTAIFGRRIYT